MEDPTEESDFVRIGRREFFDRFLTEYELSETDVASLTRVRVSPDVPAWDSPTYLVHRSLLRSHGDFPCAGDGEALEFCQEIAAEMVLAFGIDRADAVARINRQWSDADTPVAVPRVWIVGSDIAYHETAEDWAKDIYYGHDSGWWLPEADPQPLPPPTATSRSGPGSSAVLRGESSGH